MTRKKIDKLSIESRIYLKCMLPNLFIAASIFTTASVMVKLPRQDIIPAIILYIILALVVEFLLGSITNRVICHKTSQEINFWKVSGLNVKERTSLLSKVLSLPKYKTIEIFIYFELCTIALTAFAVGYAKIPTTDAITFFLTSFLLSYMSTVIAHYNVEKICSEVALEISLEELDTSVIQKKKFFGMPLSVLFTIYIIIPIILCGIFTVTVSGSTYNRDHTDFSRLFLASIFNMLTISTFTVLYFKRISKYTSQMEQTLSMITKDNIADVKKLFPVDFSSHISYSMHLINTTIRFFQRLIDNYSSVNTIIQQICQDLYSVANQTQATVVEQTTSVEEISATIKNTNNLSSIVEKKIDEVISIAAKTLESATDNNRELEKNLGKMQMITFENRKTIDSIQSLSNKINSVQDIVNLIDSVADQTKIIAFNAELEASLLYSKNDSLNNVSVEIRNLANKTNELTKEVKDHIKEIQNSSQTLIQLGQSCMELTEEANGYSEELKAKLKTIDNSATKTSEDAEKIRNGIYAQSSSMKEIENTLIEINSGARDFSETTRGITNIIRILQQNSSYIETVKTELLKEHHS